MELTGRECLPRHPTVRRVSIRAEVADRQPLLVVHTRCDGAWFGTAEVMGSKEGKEYFERLVRDVEDFYGNF